MLKEFLNDVLEKVAPHIEVINGKTYCDKDLYLVEKKHYPNPMELGTLSSLVEYIKDLRDDIDPSDLIIHIADYNLVFLSSKLDEFNKRNNYITVKTSKTWVDDGKYLDSEEFNVRMQSQFANIKDYKDLGKPFEDKDIILKTIGNLTDEATKQTNDDGVSQNVIIKTGISTLQEVKVVNPVELAPFRTFPEIEQPTSKFIFRIKDGGYCALFSADNGMWKNQAVDNIKAYLKDALAGIDIQIIG